MIRSSSDHAVFLWVYNNYKPFLAVETYDILMAKENIICFERTTQEFDTIFDYTSQEVSNLKPSKLTLLKVNMASLLTIHIISRRILFKSIGDKKKMN